MEPSEVQQVCVASPFSSAILCIRDLFPRSALLPTCNTPLLPSQGPDIATILSLPSKLRLFLHATDPKALIYGCDFSIIYGCDFSSRLGFWLKPPFLLLFWLGF